MLKIKVSRLSQIVKSERINALRKQYDAFLEEDKKRKERNEYILGRLDNMRYSSTAVQIRHKPIVYGDVMPVFNRGAYRPEQFERRDLSTDPAPQINRTNHQYLELDVQRNYLNNASLLKEISKNYILIPKLRSSLINDYVGTIPPQSLPPIAVSSPQSNITGNEDWKSKYDILEQLKNKEKEEQKDIHANNEIYPVKDITSLSKHDTKNIINNSKHDGFQTPQNDSYATQSSNAKESTAKYEQEVAEKDLAFDKIRVETKPQTIDRPKISDNSYGELANDHVPSNIAYAYTDPNTDISYNYKLQDEKLENYIPDETIESNIEPSINDSNYNENVLTTEYTTEDVTEMSGPQINDVPHQEEYPIQYEQPIEVEGKLPDTENVYLDPEDYSPIQVLNPSDVVEQIHNEPIADDATDIKESEVVEYPVEMLNVQEFTPTDDVKLIDGENVNPQYYASGENSELNNENNPQTEIVNDNTNQPNDNSEIQEFNTEQAEMFYSEETPQYAYDQQQSNVYDQSYGEYENAATALQDQEYPTEVNEHEESTAQYDQNYEQQYATEYEQQEYQGQEQQQYVQEGYDQTEQQNYVQPEDYDQTAQQYAYDETQQQYQDYEYQQYDQGDQDAVQNVQQVLDNEAGYVDQQHSEPDIAQTEGKEALVANQETT